MRNGQKRNRKKKKKQKKQDKKHVKQTIVIKRIMRNKKKTSKLEK